jgi:hypothetical protein
MYRFALILVACLFGCNHSTNPTRPAAQPTNSSGTRPILEPIELHYRVYTARLGTRITVSPDGLLRSIHTANKSYGGNDIDPKLEGVEIREGRLTLKQMADLARLPEGWSLLSSKPYGGVPDGGDVTVRYGDKTVSGGSHVPQQVTDVRARLSELARSMPLAKP